MLRKLFATAAAAALVVTGSLATATASSATFHKPAGPERPIIFVHGSSGSANQYASQAQRFAANGYPVSWVDAYEYDSTFATAPLATVQANLDTQIDELLESTGAEQVDVVAHSLGTYVVQGYLNSSPERAADVAHYVNLDGLPAAALPGDVPTLAIWGEGSTARTVVGGENVRLEDQAHTETVSSPESFTEQFTFFNDRAPRTTDITDSLLPVAISGRAVLFPRNVGVTDATLEVYWVSSKTGQRIGSRPVATYPLSGDGSFGPFYGDGEAHYEFAIVREGVPTHHIYNQPFRRSNALVRLQTSEPGAGFDAVTDKSAAQVNLTINRNKEWWGDKATGNDTMSINGTNVLTPAVAPSVKRLIGLFVFDAGSDGVSNVEAALPAFAQTPFINGVDLFVPASPDGKGTVNITVEPRNGGGKKQVVNVPAWPSDAHRISVQIDDDVPRGKR